MNKTLRALVVVALVGAIVVCAFALGVAFERVVGLDVFSAELPAPDPPVGEVVDEVAGLLMRDALEPSSVESMTAGAVGGLLDSLGDPYAAYLNEEHYGYFNQQNDGRFYGIGVLVTIRDDMAIIVSPIEGTPAFEAGLIAEDEIVSVDGSEPPGGVWTLDDIVNRIRGEEGTDVTLGIRRTNGDTEEFEVTVTRAEIDLPNIEQELIEGDIGYIRLLTFNNQAANDLADAIEDLEDQGARGIILDVRDNPGGLLDVSVDVASLFIEDGVIVTVEARGHVPEIHRARGRTATDAPLVVLVNENSASASEIVAGAIQDYERGPLVGVTTFGKGSVQNVEDLSNGGAVKFTTAHYLTPKGRSIHKKGLVPDVEVEMSPKDQAERETDVQLERAIEVLRESFE